MSLVTSVSDLVSISGHVAVHPEPSRPATAETVLARLEDVIRAHGASSVVREGNALHFRGGIFGVRLAGGKHGVSVSSGTIEVTQGTGVVHLSFECTRITNALVVAGLLIVLGTWLLRNGVGITGSLIIVAILAALAVAFFQASNAGVADALRNALDAE